MHSPVSAIMVPHPPIILPNIGRGEEKKIADIDQAYRTAAKRLIETSPDTVVIVSPHAPSYFDYIQISDGKKGKGDLSQFRDWADSFDIPYDTKLIEAISRLAEESGIPAGTLGRQDGRLDHGTMIPLWYLKDLKPETKFVRVSIGGPDSLTHYRLGKIIAQAAQSLGKTIAVVGSGDLSHCQKEGTNYGFKACGPAYDAKIMDIMGKSDFDRLLKLSEEEAEDAMVCGQKPFCVMAGALDGLKPKAENLGHSAEFGVGYGVVSYTDLEEDPSRRFGLLAEKEREQQLKEKWSREDEYVQLARKAVNACIKEGMLLQVPENLPQEMLENQAGTFVSIHKDGKLRGCIGTTAPAAQNIAREIIQNAVSASTRDPRFPAIQPWELDALDISVDVLQKPEPVQSLDELDEKKYGVIVTKGRKRGLLLPDLEGVGSVEEQVAIAKQKAGLRADEDGCSLERFEVARHH